MIYCPVCFAESDVAGFDGASYVLFWLDAATSSSPKDLLTMNFKTLHNSGVLMHMEGNHGHTLTLELLKGKLFVHLSKGSITFTQELISEGSIMQESSLECPRRLQQVICYIDGTQAFVSCVCFMQQKKLSSIVSDPG